MRGVLAVRSKGSRLRITEITLFRVYPELKEFKGIHPLVIRLLFNFGLPGKEGDRGDQLSQLSEQGTDNQAGMSGAKTSVGPIAKGDMRVGFPVEPDFPGVLEYGVVEVGRGPAKGNQLVSLDLDSMNFGVDRAFPPDVSKGGGEANEFLPRAID